MPYEGEKQYLPLATKVPQAKEPLFPPTFPHQEQYRLIAQELKLVLDPAADSTRSHGLLTREAGGDPTPAEIRSLVPWRAKKKDGSLVTSLTIGVVETTVKRDLSKALRIGKPSRETSTSYGILMVKPSTGEVYFYQDYDLIPCLITGDSKKRLEMGEDTFSGESTGLGARTFDLPLNDSPQNPVSVDIPRWLYHEPDLTGRERTIRLATLTPESTSITLASFLKTLKSAKDPQF